MNYNNTPNNYQNTEDLLEVYRKAFPECVTEGGGLDFSKGREDKPRKVKDTELNKEKSFKESDERIKRVNMITKKIGNIVVATALVAGPTVIAANFVGAPEEAKTRVPIVFEDESQTELEAVREAFREAGVDMPDEVLNHSEIEIREDLKGKEMPILEITERGRFWKKEGNRIVDNYVAGGNSQYSKTETTTQQ